MEEDVKDAIQSAILSSAEASQKAYEALQAQIKTSNDNLLSLIRRVSAGSGGGTPDDITGKDPMAERVRDDTTGIQGDHIEMNKKRTYDVYQDLDTLRARTDHVLETQTLANMIANCQLSTSNAIRHADQNASALHFQQLQFIQAQSASVTTKTGA